eukprot:SAG31_NODE_7763_length_1602_cov_0.934797_1_plen_22_part_10
MENTNTSAADQQRRPAPARDLR